MKKEKILVLCSGGLDSVGASVILESQGWDVVPVYVDYGQRVKDKELAGLAAYYHNSIILPFDLSQVIKCWATDGSCDVGSIEKGNKENYFIPARNAFMLLRVAAEAYSQGVHDIAVGNNKTNISYCDTQPEFTHLFERALDLAFSTTSARYGLRIEEPVIDCDKSDIVQIANDAGVNLSKTWSCYDTRDLHCGTCPNCVSRKEAFEIAGVRDKTGYIKE